MVKEVSSLNLRDAIIKVLSSGAHEGPALLDGVKNLMRSEPSRFEWKAILEKLGKEDVVRKHVMLDDDGDVEKVIYRLPASSQGVADGKHVA